ncbi:MAG: hypothetical protein NT018_01045 [Armatimonadetes bacterium]|nr:hypothetical protein [Armatimonadota bacterium]
MRPVLLDFIGGGSNEINPNQTSAYYLVISAIYTFKTHGTYTVKVIEGRMKQDGPEFIATSSVSTNLRVLPFDAKILSAQCKESFRQLDTIAVEQ